MGFIRTLPLSLFIVILPLAPQSPVREPDLQELSGAMQAKDFSRALRIGHTLADRGEGRAQFLIGTIYHLGLGLSSDYAEAAKWYRKAAEQGDAGAQLRLGVLYFRGAGVTQDYAETVKWLSKAAEQGSDDAQYLLAVMYNAGQGVAQDYVWAHTWMNVAASRAQGDSQKKYAKAREAVAEKMTPEQIAEAQRLAREWKPK
jgi:uncharacterized protein